MMLYRPNYCCNCGEKIERIEWNLLTSRRFCVVCATERKAHDVIPRITVAAGFLALMFGFGSLWAGSGNAEQRSVTSPVGIRSAVPPTAGQVDEIPSAAVRPGEPQKPEQSKTGTTETAEKNAEKYFCGALTKKGTPCSRKVKAKGMRCFQHEGRSEAPKAD